MHNLLFPSHLSQNFKKKLLSQGGSGLAMGPVAPYNTFINLIFPDLLSAKHIPSPFA
jgi:hypothetical protein